MGVFIDLSEVAATFTKDRLFERPTRYHGVISLQAAYREPLANWMARNLSTDGQGSF